MSAPDMATDAKQQILPNERDVLAAELNALLAERDALSGQLAVTRERLDQAQKTLAAIYASRRWKFLLAYDRRLPSGSRRRAVADALGKASVWLGKAVLGFHRRRLRSAAGSYDLWIALNEPKSTELEAQRRTSFAWQPTISILVPTWNPPVPFLTAMLDSVRSQTYTRWELCIADGGSDDPEVAEILNCSSGNDPRIRVRFLPDNRGIAGNSQQALALATGAYVALLDQDDTLAPFALYEVVRALNQYPDADLLYSDEDTLDTTGTRRAEPHFKPDWSPDTLRSYNYVCHLAVFRRLLLEKIGGFRPGFEGAQDYDLTLRAGEQARRIIHIPKVLYHWSVHPQSVTAAETVKGYAYESAKKALSDHLRRCGSAAPVTDGPLLGTYRITYPVASRPLVSIIIPNQDHPELLARCVESVLRSDYSAYEILLVENRSRRPETFSCYRRLQQRAGVRVLTWDQPFNFAAVNNLAASQARGDVLLFLNNDVEAINPDWLEQMLAHALRPEVGAVGAKLYYPDDTVQHAGIILGVGGVAGHSHRHYPRTDAGYARRLRVVQNLSAVTGACLMTRRAVFEQVGGFDERFVLIYNDVDLCLRLRQKGYVIVWTPWAELYHHESTTRGGDNTPQKQARVAGEVALLRSRWGDVLGTGDPYYNPNLTLQREDFSLRI
jgi:GT2 family glycosyltransferase